MSAIQEARYSVTTVAPRSFRYYAAGAVVHVALAAGLAAFGFGWSAAPLVVAAVLAVIAVRVRRRRPTSARRRPSPLPPVVH